MNIVIKDNGKEGHNGRFTATAELYKNNGSFFYNAEIIGWGPTEEDARNNIKRGMSDMQCFME